MGFAIARDQRDVPGFLARLQFEREAEVLVFRIASCQGGLACDHFEFEAHLAGRIELEIRLLGAEEQGALFTHTGVGSGAEDRGGSQGGCR